MPSLHRYQAPMARRKRGGIRGAWWDNESYNDVLDLDGWYFVYVCIRDTGRAREMEAKKEAERSRKERMGTVPISEFSRHRALVADGDRGRGGGGSWQWLWAYNALRGEEGGGVWSARNEDGVKWNEIDQGCEMVPVISISSHSLLKHVMLGILYQPHQCNPHQGACCGASSSYYFFSSHVTPWIWSSSTPSVLFSRRLFCVDWYPYSTMSSLHPPVEHSWPSNHESSGPQTVGRRKRSVGAARAECLCQSNRIIQIDFTQIWTAT